MKQLIEEADGFTQIFEEDCFGKDINPEDVETFRVICDSWSIDQDGKHVRRIYTAEVIKLLKS